MDDKAARRLEAMRALLEDARGVLGLDFGFRLWDGSTVPADLAPGSMTIAFADEAVVGELVRRPRLDTLIAAHAAGRIDLIDASLFDLAERRPAGKVGRLLRRISKRRAFDVARLFWFAPSAEPAASGLTGSGEGGERIARNKRDIAFHYDVSNAFYRLFLDPEMVYSCAYFTQDHDDIARAQHDKLEMICRKLRLSPGERFLDVGCGWGALILHAARHHGVEAVGITLAENQAALARERIAAAGLQDRVRVEIADYTEIRGEFDKIASIGMFEHVGLANHPTYFRAIHALLRPRGLYLHHAITRRAKRTEKQFAKGTSEYRALTRYIFPGGELDHVGMSTANLERHGFEVHDVEGWREHYARTCRLWWERLQANRDLAVAEIGAEKTRLWSLYLAGCALAFERGGAQIFQTLASRRTRGTTGLPLTRADLYR
jgi:cyclopropane-fatty-acyl-phospholipid synthase